MEKVRSGFTIADYCAAMRRREIVVNREYQRSDKVWPQVARSYLIETVLKGFPIPKFYLYQVTDVKSRSTYKEIVDGQQRSNAISDFLADEFRVSRSAEDEDVRGRKYSELEPEDQRRFLEYALDADIFVSATPSEVVEVFRRMNSYTVPLNAEENRHASFEGAFKWFINDLADKLEPAFLAMGTFREKQLVRMADNKLLTELCESFLSGIRTTNKKILDAIYRKFDGEFPQRGDWRSRLLEAFDTVRGFDAIYGTALAKPHMMYSLAQAVAHVRRPVAKFEGLFRSPRLRDVSAREAVANLTALLQALEAEEDDSTRYSRFVAASKEKTNVRENRRVRFKWFCKALTGERFS